MTNEKSVVFEYSQLVLTNPVKLNQATYMVNFVLPISKFPLSYWTSLSFSFSIPGLLLVDLFPAPVTSSHSGPWTYPSEEKMYFNLHKTERKVNFCPFAVYYLLYAVRSFFTISRISLADSKRAGQKVHRKIAVAGKFKGSKKSWPPQNVP
jgi:hypothetical protein